MLAALTAVAAMSQSFRTVATVVAGGLGSEFGATAEEIGLFAGAFHVAFALAQIPIGVAMDLFGPRRTVGAALAIAVLGALASALAPTLPVAIAGQALIGIGCAPAFLGTILFVAERYPAERFAQLSGLVLSLSGIGMLATATPLAWVVTHWSWRAGFLGLAAASFAILVAVIRLVDETPARRREADPKTAFAALGPILLAPHTAGILALGAVGYAAFLTLRGLWAVPLLGDRHGFSLVESGHVVLAMSVATLLGPPLFGLLNVGARARRFWIIGGAVLSALAFLALARSASAVGDVALMTGLGLLTGYFVLQYADIRDAYAPAVRGRALALFNTAVFLGVALLQSATGFAATLAAGHGADPLFVILALIAAALVLAALAFVLLPWPPAAASRPATAPPCLTPPSPSSRRGR